MADTTTTVKVKINGDSTGFEAGTAAAQAAAARLADNLVKAAAQGAAAFVAIRTGILGSVEAFAESDAASKRLEAALLQQGILSGQTSEKYDALADSVSRLTGEDDDLIKATLATGQAYLGNIQASDELLRATADLSAGLGISLNDAYEKVTKTIGSKTNALAKNGIEVSDNLTRQERMAKVISEVESRFGGQAAAAQNVGTSIKSLGVAFGNAREAIGEQFAPAIKKAADYLADLLTWFSQNKELVKWAAIIGGAALTVAGLAAGIAAATSALTVMAPALGVIGSVLGAIMAVNPFVLLLAAITAVAYYWEDVWPFMTRVFKAFIDNIAEMGVGFKDLLVGFFTLDPAQISRGLDGVKAAFTKAMSDFSEAAPKVPPVDTTEADAKIAALNAKNAADRAAELTEANAHALRLQAIAANKTEIMTLEAANASAELIRLKREENTVLEEMNKEHTGRELELLRERLDAIREAEALEIENSKIQRQIVNEELLADNAAFNQLQSDEKARFLADIAAKEASQILTGKTARMANAKDELDTQIQTNNQFLKDKAQFGAAYATLNKIIHSDTVKGAQTAAGELVQLSQSSNAELKAIGKAAALSQIAIDTARSTATLMASIQQAVPFPFSVPVQAAAVAGRIAFGLEQAGKVMAAADGGLMTGGVAGVDSIPAMLTPGELVVPTRNFEEVVGAVKAQRQSGNDDVVSELRALRAEVANGAGQAPQVVVHGDVLGDDSFVDTLIRRINDRLEFGNAKLVGVTS